MIAIEPLGAMGDGRWDEFDHNIAERFARISPEESLAPAHALADTTRCRSR